MVGRRDYNQRIKLSEHEQNHLSQKKRCITFAKKKLDENI